MTDEDLALFGALDDLGAWPHADHDPDVTEDDLREEFGELVGRVLDALRERNGREVVGPADFEALVAEAEGRDDLIAHPWALDGARIMLKRFEGEAEHLARQQGRDN
jgi:hypothetical protein